MGLKPTRYEIVLFHEWIRPFFFFVDKLDLRRDETKLKLTTDDGSILYFGRSVISLDVGYNRV